ncbi:hypothetical protein [Anaerobaca lacustris]|uniref:PEP-CTERM sorting domain-containing protein n=1 Tax=Anaerobaca lacustris TaxID=3044600 RepID=A0AAW6U4N6_9BACT|nr:hypothetical protein [Sedimentisphaerales bacterium M17dextr]
MVIPNRMCHPLSVLGVLLLLSTTVLTVPAQADLEIGDNLQYTYDFTCITNNNAIDAAVGEAQLSVIVSADQLTDQWARFTFYNAGPEPSSIKGVYFYDGALLGNDDVTLASSSGVSFAAGADPAHLPGYSESATRVFAADADPPPPKNGVQEAEWLEVLFDLAEGKTFADVLGSINRGFADGYVAGASLVIGVHVIAFTGGGSESFIMVPVPGAALLGFLGFGWAGLKLRKRV